MINDNKQIYGGSYEYIGGVIDIYGHSRNT